MRILIAEDELTSRTMLHRFLENYGDVDVTVNGAEALNAFTLALNTNEPYDLICLDVMMPEMDGVTALGRIRIKEKSMRITPDREVKIIMTTSLEFLKEGLTTGHKHLVRCDEYITKPVDLEKLAEILEKYGITRE